ncbi:hypothetical protein ABFS82_09G024600 [Erythranthe guttata]|nr:PREDICTED: RING-H2 finger protein ATL47-like [Erythranthe guttata]|eukprot:XP_012831193.1 PREDICTED: RING-H2 finger protein ATL47-like [Erythranthe guttata]
MAKISPMLLLVIVILSIGFFVLGLLQLLIRFLMKSPSSPFPSISQPDIRLPEPSRAASSRTFQRQLQHLFRSHDSGLDRSSIDALPVFYYKDVIVVMGSKEPFDCAVCLCEFSESDKLKFLPDCGHAFHIQCIETWLLSNSTCPLCRGLISTTHRNNPVAKWELSYDQPNGISQESPSMVFPVCLGKFRRLSEGLANEDQRRDDDVSGSTSRIVDARRCYSMGAFEYIVGHANVQVALFSGNDVRCCTKEKFDNTNIGIDGKKIDPRSRGDSFSVSKIWLWSKKGKFPTFSDTDESIVMPMPNGSNLV